MTFAYNFRKIICESHFILKVPVPVPVYPLDLKIKAYHKVTKENQQS